MNSYYINTNNDYTQKKKHIDVLFDFLKNNRDEQFIEYLSNFTKDNIDINIRNENGNHIIHYAIVMNNKNIVKKILEYDCILDTLDIDGYSILYYPIKFNYFEIFEMLLKYDAGIIGISLVNIIDIRGDVPLFYAIKFNNHSAIIELFKFNADVNYKNKNNINSLHLAISKKDIVIVKMILKYINNPNIRTIKGLSALHYASKFELYDVIKLLIENKCDINISDFESNYTPIFTSIIFNKTAINKLFIDNNADVSHQDYMGNTPMHYIISNGDIEMLDYIMSKYNIIPKYKNLDITIPEKIFGIDTNLSNIDGHTFVHLMLIHYKSDYEKYLYKILPNTDLNNQDNNGNSILHYISIKHLWNVYSEILKNSKLNVYITNKNNKTPLDILHISEFNMAIDIVSISYYNYLKKYPSKWDLEWKNKCSNEDNKSCIEYIKNDILKNKVSAPIYIDKVIISLDEQINVSFSTYQGSTLDIICGFKYLTKKYPYVTTPIIKDNKKIESFFNNLDNKNTDLFEVVWKFQKIYFPSYFDEEIKNIFKEKKYKYIAIPIGIFLSNESHANCVFIDIDKLTVERFEPHGSANPKHFNYNPELLDEILNRKFDILFKEILGDTAKYTYYKPKQYLPRIGFQMLDARDSNTNKNIGDPEGFCGPWIIWYLDYRIKYINVPSSRVVSSLINKVRMQQESFRTIIRNYSVNITNLRDTYLKIIGYNINDFINDKLSLEETIKLFCLINNDF
jgi:ankyrin repeat protein